MSEIKTERKVTVILAADVVGYSTMMEANEEQTLKNLTAFRTIVDSLIEAHHGRIFNTAGDSVLAEFPSAVEAVFCAREFQDSIRERNNSVEEAERLEFRVGINMGDVVVEGENLLGEGVNVASRLEALAQVGGICVSKNVHEAVHNKMEMVFHDLGRQKVKNTILHAVDISLEGISKRKPPKPTTPQWHKLAVAIVITALLAGGGVWWLQRPDFKPADQSKFTFKLPDKPSIAVLPFNNMSGDTSQDYLGDGLTENIIAVLATSPNVFVISRNSSFTYKGKAVKVQEVAEQLGVRYVLEGSVQRSGEKLRVTAQLVDAVDGKHLWAERYDRKLDDLFAVQDEITNKIFYELHVTLTIGQRSKDWQKHFGDPEGMRLHMKGFDRFLTFTIEGHHDAERIYGELYKKNPDGGMGNLDMGWIHWAKLVMRLTDDPMQSIKLGREFGEKAHAVMGDGNSLTLLAWFDLFERDYESAIENARRATEISPSDGEATAIAGTVYRNSGKPEESAILLKRAMRLQPYHPNWYAWQMGISLLVLEKYDEAEEVFEAVLQSGTEIVSDKYAALGGLAVISVFRQNLEDAEKYASQLRELVVYGKKFNLSIFDPIFGLMKNQEFVKRYLDALRQLGIPEKS